MKYFDYKELNILITSIPSGYELLFGLTVAERMVPNYHKYLESGKAGDFLLFRNTLDLLWNVQNFGIIIKNKDMLVKKIMSQIPDADSQDWTQLTSAALDTASVLSELLEYNEDNLIKHIMDISSYAIDTVHMSLEFDDPKPDVDKEMMAPLIQKELQTQFETLQYIIKNKDKQTTNTLYKLWYHTTKGSLEM